MILSPSLTALIASGDLRVAPLVYFDFSSGPMRVWAGFGALDSGGHVWSGLGELGAISGVEIPVNGSAPQAQFTLSGVAPDLLATALSAREETYDRDVIVYLQHFDLAGVAVDAPLPLYHGRMDVMKARRTEADRRVVEVSAEWLFARRAIPAFAALTDHDQRARASGDLGAAYVASMQSKSYTFPV